MKQTLFSGIKPTGEMHLGNYLGAVKNWITLQSKYRSFFSIVDYHALTIDIAPRELSENSFNLAVDLLALGLDPKHCILFRQSDVPEHTELSWIFACLTPVAELSRMTQYKDMVQEEKTGANAGLFTYPVLQAADILLYKAEYVPVGEDQIQHLELGRVIARKFNNRYGKCFPEIQPLLTEHDRVMALNDPSKKMSKHLGPKSYIALRDAPEVVRQKIGRATTDNFEGNATLGGGHNLLMLYKNFAPAEEFRSAQRAYKLKTLSYAALKKDLVRALTAFLEPVQKRQRYFESHPDEVGRILRSGAQRARRVARQTIRDVRTRIGLPERANFR